MKTNMLNIQQNLTVIENRPLTGKTWKISLRGDNSAITKPGQFVNIAIPGKYLRRPISVHSYERTNNLLVLLYDVVGEGTRMLSEIEPGQTLNILMGLGNGFSIPDYISHPILLGGGIGCAPLFQLALDLIMNGKKPVLVLGFNTKEDIVEDMNILKSMGIPILYATIDGTFGTKGFVTDVIKENNLVFDYFYACGPLPMLLAVSSLPCPGELSLESRMGCGFGACMCCSIETKNGSRRICKEGPVFMKDDIIWKQ